MSTPSLNSHAPPPLGPLSLVLGAWRQRGLIRRLVWREVVGRYRGSVAGLAWSMLHPLLMLAVYTFVFSVVFQARWGELQVGQTRAHFALVLFVGVVMHGLLSEAVVRAPGLILGNRNLVKKVVFPLETLPWSVIGAALFHAAVSMVMLLLAIWALEGPPPLTALWLPVMFLPLVAIALGVTWALAALGVFLRDIAQITGVISAVLLFMAPVFYPLETLPDTFRPWFYVNPLTLPIEQARAVLFAGQAPELAALGRYSAVAALVAASGYALFQKTRRGFADVL